LERKGLVVGRVAEEQSIAEQRVAGMKAVYKTWSQRQSGIKEGPDLDHSEGKCLVHDKELWNLLFVILSEGSSDGLFGQSCRERREEKG